VQRTNSEAALSVVKLFPYDITPILDMLPAFDDLWGEDRLRQTLPFSPHKNSEVIHLRRQPGSRPRDILHQLASVATRHHIGALAVAIDEICVRTEGRPARAMLVRLSPGGVIAEHTDTGIYFTNTERFHVPILTNPKAWLTVDGEKYHLAAGVCYALDNKVAHSGANEGDAARIHLIIDTHPESPAVLAG